MNLPRTIDEKHYCWVTIEQQLNLMRKCAHAITIMADRGSFHGMCLSILLPIPFEKMN